MRRCRRPSRRLRWKPKPSRTRWAPPSSSAFRPIPQGGLHWCISMHAMAIMSIACNGSSATLLSSCQSGAPHACSRCKTMQPAVSDTACHCTIWGWWLRLSSSQVSKRWWAVFLFFQCLDPLISIAKQATYRPKGYACHSIMMAFALACVTTPLPYWGAGE